METLLDDISRFQSGFHVDAQRWRELQVATTGGEHQHAATDGFQGNGIGEFNVRLTVGGALQAEKRGQDSLIWTTI